MISNLVSKHISARFLHLSNIGLYSEINFKKLAIDVLETGSPRDSGIPNCLVWV